MPRYIWKADHAINTNPIIRPKGATCYTMNTVVVMRPTTAATINMTILVSACITFK